MTFLFSKLLPALACALALSAPLAAQTQATAAATVAVPPRDPAPGDTAQQRRLVLPNGMKVLLWSDPKLNTSSAALAVGVGSLADPPQRQGLAHFLEHMLFLGTEKYPRHHRLRRLPAPPRRHQQRLHGRRPHQLLLRDQARRLRRRARPLQPVLHRAAVRRPLHRARDQRRGVGTPEKPGKRPLAPDAAAAHGLRRRPPGAPLRHRQPRDAGRHHA
jgi:hypothetical protein